jgi:hypothetical protein
MMQEQEGKGNVEKERSTTTKPEITFLEILHAVEDSLSDLARSEDEEDGEDEDHDEEETGQCKLSEDDEPGSVMGTICKTVQHHMGRFRQKHLRLEERTQPGWGDAADYFQERVMRYRTTELKIPAVGKPKADSTAATPSQTTFGVLMQTVGIVPGQSQMPQVSFRQGSSQMRLGLEKPQANNHIVLPMPTAEPDSSPIEIAKPVQPVSFFQCI